jgi:hypothetical protein
MAERLAAEAVDVLIGESGGTARFCMRAAGCPDRRYVSEQLDDCQPEAWMRLRARAFSQRRAVADVAADVVARRMRFDDNAG